MVGDRVRPLGRFVMESRDARGRVLGRRAFPNGVTVGGADYLLERGFRGRAAIAAWYVGLINDAGFLGLDDDDTHDLHPLWTEWLAVFGSNRAAWAPAAAASAALTGPNVTLQITASGAVRGALLASQQAVGTGAGPVLYSTGAADSALAVAAGGTVTLGYQLRLTP